MLMGLAIECALSRAERQNMLINDFHLTPMQSTALHFFWTEKYKKNQNERGAKIFSALHVNEHVWLTLSVCCEAIFTMLDIYVLGNLIIKLGFCKKSFSLSSLWHFAALHHLHLVCISFAHNFQIIIIKEKPLQQITLNLKVTYVYEKKHQNLH